VSSTLAVREIKRMLAERFRITHATIEIEYDACVDGPKDARKIC
jgi:Co/Zn/Cd efflux system component